MENNEIMQVANEVMDEGIVADATTGISTGTAMLIGAGVTAATFAVIGLVKRGIAAIKAKKAEQQSDFVDDCDLVDEA
jgi:hypothetical protein